MNPLTLDDILDIDTYETIREGYRPRVLEHKKRRRFGVGDRVSLVFEDRETLRYQIQEMIRVERTRDPEKIQQELDAYNDLVPGRNELSATLFIEIPELREVRPELDRLVGIDEHVFWVLGEDDDEERVRARFDPKQMEEDRISAVQYIRFAFAPEQVGRLARGDRARVRIEHPRYRYEAELPDDVRESLLRDLRDETPRLLDPRRVARAEAPRDEVLFSDPRVRVLRPAEPAGPHHVIVEAVPEVSSIVEASPDLLAALLSQVQRYAREVADRGGGCRVMTDVPGPRTRTHAPPRLRWHLLGRRA